MISISLFVLFICCKHLLLLIKTHLYTHYVCLKSKFFFKTRIASIHGLYIVFLTFMPLLLRCLVSWPITATSRSAVNHVTNSKNARCTIHIHPCVKSIFFKQVPALYVPHTHILAPLCIVWI